MRIRISDKSLNNGELTLKVSNFLVTSQEMFFDLDNRWLGNFLATAVAKGMVKYEAVCEAQTILANYRRFYDNVRIISNSGKCIKIVRRYQ
jgi:hypothetical protein